MNEIAGEYEVHPSQLTRWKKQVKDSLPEIFRNSSKKKSETEDLTPKLYEEIGRLKMVIIPSTLADRTRSSQPNLIWNRGRSRVLRPPLR